MFVAGKKGEKMEYSERTLPVKAVRLEILKVTHDLTLKPHGSNGPVDR